MGNQGVQRKNSLNMNLNGGKLIQLGNQVEGIEINLNLNIKGGKSIKWEIKACKGKAN